jgi:hypothetical protein
MVLKSLNSLNNDVERNLKLTIHPAIIEDTKEISAILAQSFYSFPEFAHWIYPFDLASLPLLSSENNPLK